MEPDQQHERPPLGRLLESLRKRQRFTRHALAGRSGVSTTYIVQIEGGIDSRTGKEIHPSPPVLRRLADALGDGYPEDADRFYAELMAAVGYLPGDETDAARPAARETPRYFTTARSTPPPSRPPPGAAPGFERSVTPALPHEEPSRYGEPDGTVTVSLRDPRLHTHFMAVADHWEELSRDEQIAVLMLMELVDERRRRR